MKYDYELINKEIKLLISFSGPFAFLCAISYLLSFWYPLGINFLEFIYITDILKITIYPLLFFLIFGGIYCIIISRSIADTIDNIPVDIFIKSKKEIIIKSFITMQFAALFFLYFMPLPGLFLVIGCPAYIFLCICIMKIFKKSTPEFYERNRKVLYYYLTPIGGMVFLSVFLGIVSSSTILHNFGVRYVSTSNFKDSHIFGNQLRVKYIGLGGKHYFFISEDNSNIYIVNSEEVGTLELSKKSSEKFVPFGKRAINWFK